MTTALLYITMSICLQCGKAPDVVTNADATPAPLPVAPVRDRISVPGDPIPYYATPKIMVHKPSESFQSDTSGPRTIDEILARERGEPSFQEHSTTSELPLAPPGYVYLEEQYLYEYWCFYLTKKDGIAVSLAYTNLCLCIAVGVCSETRFFTSRLPFLTTCNFAPFVSLC